MLHEPVLLDEVIAYSGIKAMETGTFVDATFGRGGHTRALLQHLSAQGRVMAIDRDPEAVAYAKNHFSGVPNFFIEHATFSQLKTIMKTHGLLGKVKGLLIDLGVSSPQLDDAHRGMSFSKDGPLDMRMDPTQGMPVSEWLAQATSEEIADVLINYGEERFSRRIAQAIVKSRQTQRLETTSQLVSIIRQAIPFSDPHKHPATRSFQALRIYINRELEELETVLKDMHDILDVGGRCLVISFHSLEDRIVKRFFRESAKNDEYPRGLPIQARDIKLQWRLIGRVEPSFEETTRNPRSRSAKLRVMEKIA